MKRKRSAKERDFGVERGDELRCKRVLSDIIQAEMRAEADNFGAQRRRKKAVDGLIVSCQAQTYPDTDRFLRGKTTIYCKKTSQNDSRDALIMTVALGKLCS